MPTSSSCGRLYTLIAVRLNYSQTFPVSGQTYSRKQNTQILELLSGICASAHKMSTHLRLLAHLSKIEEPFGKNQVGSSALQRGADRQSMHELIRKHSQDVGYALKNLDAENDLLERLLNDPAFPLNPDEIAQILKVEDFIGRAPEQVEEFIAEFIQPLLENTGSKTIGPKKLQSRF